MAPTQVTASTTLERWREYALAGITPSYSWGSPAVAAAPTVFSLYASSDRDEALQEEPSALEKFRIALAQSLVSDVPFFGPGRATGNLIDQPLSGLQQLTLTPSLSQRFGDDGIWTVSAIIAHQRFATWGLGSVAWSSGHLPPVVPRVTETSVGSGVRLEMSDALSERLRVSAGFQSRVDMDEFNTYRGVYSDPGNFDIPASAAMGLDLMVTPRTALGVSAQRVLYSDISPFTSAALPTRFLSLLGDGSSPEFAWQDLTVYSADWTWRGTGQSWQLRYTTRQQPAPTSDLLYDALASEFTDNNLALTYSRATGKYSQLSVATSYAPSQYFLGNSSSYMSPDGDGGRQIEFEARWAIEF